MKVPNLNRLLHGILYVLGTWVVFSTLNHHSTLRHEYTSISSSLMDDQAMLKFSFSGQSGSKKKKNQKTIGQRLIERSFQETWADLLTVCPKNVSVSSVTTTLRKEFLNGCLAKLRTEGNTDGSEYNKKWPWWLRTLYRDMALPVNGIVEKWHMLQLSDPRLTMCVYEKGGTKHWKQLACRHNHLVVSKNVGKPIPNFNHCYKNQPPYDDELHVQKKTGKIAPPTDPTEKSKKVVFLRDPLDRFLSGFLDKCGRRLDTVDHCEPATVFFNNSTSPVHNLLWDKKMFFQMYVDTVPLKWNLHFFPQALQCGGLYRDIDQYDFVGSMGSDLYRDLERLGERYPKLEESIEAIFEISKRVHITNHTGVETNAAAQVLEYYTPKTVRRVLEFYSLDYILLNLPIPDWAEEMLSQEEDD